MLTKFWEVLANQVHYTVGQKFLDLQNISWSLYLKLQKAPSLPPSLKETTGWLGTKEEVMCEQTEKIRVALGLSCWISTMKAIIISLTYVVMCY